MTPPRPPFDPSPIHPDLTLPPMLDDARIAIDDQAARRAAAKVRWMFGTA